MQVGTLDHTIIPEASGLAVSRQFADRLYHVNDSGDGPFFYLTDLQGRHTQKVRIDGFQATRADVEDIGLGPCVPHTACLFVGNIGDNLRIRQSIEVWVIEELRSYGQSVTPLHRLILRYPDGPHDAEGLAVHPNGDIYVLTKETEAHSKQAMPARLVRLPGSQGQLQPTARHTMALVGEIDLPAFAVFDGSHWGALATGLDIAQHGKSFLVLTYRHAWEFHIDLAEHPVSSPLKLVEGQNYQRIRLLPLRQQEAIAYIPDSSSLLYTTESHRTGGAIMRVDCLEAR